MTALFECPADQRQRHAKAAAQAVEQLRTLSLPTPQISDEVARWLPVRAVDALHAAATQWFSLSTRSRRG